MGNPPSEVTYTKTSDLMDVMQYNGRGRWNKSKNGEVPGGHVYQITVRRYSAEGAASWRSINARRSERWQRSSRVHWLEQRRQRVWPERTRSARDLILARAAE